MNLGEYTEALAYETAFWMQALENRDYPVDQLGDVSLDISNKFRALAVVALTAGGDPDLFYHNLIRSARSRLCYLERVTSAREFSDYHYCSGRHETLTDSIAADEWTLAKRLVELSPSEFREGFEYEDDYCYAQILSRWIAEPSRDQEVPPLLERFADYVEPESNARLAVCQALAVREQDAFDEAFADLLDARDQEIEAAKARGQLEEPQVVAERRVFVEGLALLRLAEHRGLRTEQEYRYCPSLARVPMQTPFPGE
jgi:hypothetical protein